MAEVVMSDSKGNSKKLTTNPKTWSVTVGQVTAGFYEYTVESGPFAPGTTQTIAKFTCENTGGLDGTVHFSADQVDANGNVVKNIMNDCTYNTVSGQCASWNSNEEPDSCGTQGGGGCSYMWDNNPGYVTTTMPSPGGRYHYGMKTWGADESEPGYSPLLLEGTPSPTGTPIPDTFGCLLPRVVRGDILPRIQNKEIVPRISCLMERK